MPVAQVHFGTHNGIEQQTLLLVDDPLYLLSHSHSNVTSLLFKGYTEAYPQWRCVCSEMFISTVTYLNFPPHRAVEQRLSAFLTEPEPTLIPTARRI